MPTKIYYYLEITTTHKLSQKILKFEQNQNPNTPKGARIITHKTLVFNSLTWKKKKKKKKGKEEEEEELRLTLTHTTKLHDPSLYL